MDPVPSIAVWRIPEAQLAAWARPGRVTIVTCDDLKAQMQLLRYLVERGICVLVDPGTTLNKEALEELRNRALSPLLLQRGADLLFSPPLPTVCLAPPTWTDVPADWLSTPHQERLVLVTSQHLTAGGEALDFYDVQWRSYAAN